MGSTGLASCFLGPCDFTRSPFKSLFLMEAGYNQSYLLPSVPPPPPSHLGSQGPGSSLGTTSSLMF